ncbi:MAG TPA: nuclear transport factor 2 family protein [Noviherbaspirillum sp.]|jgi:ketosteroid isomerase-like protein|uniref:nuclear transport factor 2 family protein n=1 Tax=Noviherbaspirillum sp. TaxID=1926288 RepID=UPI002F92B3C0
MDQQQVRSMAETFIARLHSVEQGESAGVDTIVEMFADDAELSNPLVERTGHERKGRDQIAQFWREYRGVFRDIHSEFTDVTASDHSAGLFWRSTGTDAGGKPLEYEGVSLLTFNEDGKIRHFKGYFDSRQVSAA